MHVRTIFVIFQGLWRSITRITGRRQRRKYRLLRMSSAGSQKWNLRSIHLIVIQIQLDLPVFLCLSQLVRPPAYQPLCLLLIQQSHQPTLQQWFLQHHRRRIPQLIPQNLQPQFLHSNQQNCLRRDQRRHLLNNQLLNQHHILQTCQQIFLLHCRPKSLQLIPPMFLPGLPLVCRRKNQRGVLPITSSAHIWHMSIKLVF